MTEDGRKTERRRQVRAIKGLEKDPNNRGARLRGLWSCRMAAGLTQRELAEMVGTGQGTIHDLERQQRGAYPKTIRRLCAALDVEPADLICEDP